MKTQDIKKMGLAYVQVLEATKKSMDPVDQDELKGTHAQRKDRDIDNDGDEDASDKYIHKRRQAISNSIKNEDVERVDEVKSTNWPVYSRILEKRDEHTKGAIAAEPINSKASAGEKAFVAKHGGHDGNESEINGHEAAKHTATVATQNVKVAPARHNDQKIGDKSMPKPK